MSETLTYRVCAACGCANTTLPETGCFECARCGRANNGQAPRALEGVPATESQSGEQPAAPEKCAGDAAVLRLNLGAGKVSLPGYVNIDRKTGGEVFPLAYPDASVDEIRASHILEHFGHREIGSVLREWVRVLKPGGVLKVAVPNLKWIAERYLEDADFNLCGYLYGGQLDQNDFHKCPFDEELLRGLFDDLGLVDAAAWEPDAEDCSSDPVSLNLQARKPVAVTTAETAPVSDHTQPFEWLRKHVYNRYSQYGEDGLLAAVLERIGATNRWCCEVGAHDGMTFSNTRNLLEQGWTGVLIEKDCQRAERLKENLPAQSGVGTRVINLEAQASGRNSLDFILEQAGAPKDLDLLVVDVDGADYYLWNGLLQYRPRVVMCEFCPEVDPEFIPPPGGPGQAGREAIIRVAYSKGYRPVCITGCNLIFVCNEYVEQCKDPGCQIPADIGQRITAVMTLPRLAFTDNMFCALKALVPLKIQLERNSGVYWGQCLTALMKPHVAEPGGLRYILTIDYDTAFKLEDILLLYRTMEAHPEIDALVPLQMKRECKTPLFTLRDREGKPRGEVTREELLRETVPIHSGHFGLTLLRIEALQKLAHPWFVGDPGPEGDWGDGHYDDDIWFWKHWRDSGFTVHQANRVAIGHLQMLVTWPGQDLTPIQQYVSDFETGGKPAGAWL